MVKEKAKDILATPQGKVVTLSDGKQYTLSPMNLNVLANLEDVFDCNLDELQEVFSKRTTTNFRKFLKVMLQENYPELTLEDVGRLVEISQVSTLLSEMMEGLKT